MLLPCARLPKNAGSWFLPFLLVWSSKILAIAILGAELSLALACRGARMSETWQTLKWRGGLVLSDHF
jgi:chaperone required for assembly of F1-ATPase